MIESMANRIVESGQEVRSMILSRDEAEKRYGFRLYQGGAVPGEELRVISIEGLDTEACGGTHLKNTSEAERITITGTKKIQDGILRLEYVAGHRAREMYENDLKDLRSIMKMMGIVDPDELVETSADIFNAWKKFRKFNSKAGKMDSDRKKEALERIKEEVSVGSAMGTISNWRSLDIIDPEMIMGDPGPDVIQPHEHLNRSSAVFKVQKKQFRRTVARFLAELNGWMNDLGI